ncbi:MAG: glycosyltransferase family 4 protein [Saprospiraceae bacterium]|nr:glycosyltransferase family 4 protein [Saprospiraceae bacterium]MCF8248474.1 glycosyltransferase family 4 protein [Saprospiraceae bacterium]MCF8281806.1 glycosyltransferase family 4 protein [Bacteroidales bacterium]MCF8310208.1 glycosyltransferase family 4 protein [Saprospiraceae bacterium]MCF8439353.1 glycosyltransferase family 4 protein [Saprospiraceae bacterium]
MKILLITKKFPFPLKEGEPIAINYLAKSLTRKGCIVDLLVLNTSKHYFNPDDFPSSENFFNEVHSVKVDNDIRIGGALRSLLTGKSYILDRFQSTDFEEKLEDLLRSKRYDVVQMETIYLAHYLPTIRKLPNVVIVLRAHNVEHEIWERVAANSSNLLKKWYLKNQNCHLRRFEIEHLNQFDVLLAITARDLEAFRGLGYQNEGAVAPVGINLVDYPLDNQVVSSPNDFCFIGALDWMPNQHGVLWFLEKVWKRMALQYPKAKFHIAGKNTPAWLHTKAGTLATVHGEVPDAKEFILKYPVMVAPLFSGSGIKIKVLEGMALGRVVITTTIGAEGIPAKPGRHLLIADTASEFEKQMNWCMVNPVSMQEMGLQAREFIREHFSNLEIAGRVHAAYEKVLSRW